MFSSSANAVGLVRTSLLDYPGHVAAVLFTHRCVLRCPYCHNPQLVRGDPPEDFIPLSEALAFLRRRSAVLDGVCITGGEPLLHSFVREAAAEIREMGLRVKLDTSGVFPRRLEGFPADYVALDVKTSPSRYRDVTGGHDVSAAVLESINYLQRAGIAHEFRTTVAPGLVDANAVREIVSLLAPGATYALQQFRPGTTLDPAFSARSPYTEERLQEMKSIAEDAGVRCTLRM